MTEDLTRRGFGLLTLAAGLALARPSWAQDSTGYANSQLLVDADALAARIAQQAAQSSGTGDGPVLIDVRPRADFDAGHIPGAQHLEPNAVVAGHSPVDGSLKPVAALETLLGALGVAADRQVVLYDDKGGFHAARMFWLLEYLGHRNVALLNGGYSAWTGAGHDASTKAVAHPPAVFHAAPSPRRYASAQDVLLQNDAPGGVLIDVRPTRMYEDGHIPWAVNVPWAQNLDDAARFRSAGDLLDHFARHGVSPDHNVILHCQVGLASAHSYVALRLLGFPRVRVYHRSWAEWGNDPSLPKVLS
ncbi:MAG: sulfurtransferase [Pseudomonadota bacterium]